MAGIEILNPELEKSLRNSMIDWRNKVISDSERYNKAIKIDTQLSTVNSAISQEAVRQLKALKSWPDVAQKFEFHRDRILLNPKEGLTELAVDLLSEHIFKEGTFRKVTEGQIRYALTDDLELMKTRIGDFRRLLSEVYEVQMKDGEIELRITDEEKHNIANIYQKQVPDLVKALEIFIFHPSHSGKNAIQIALVETFILDQCNKSAIEKAKKSFADLFKGEIKKLKDSDIADGFIIIMGKLALTCMGIIEPEIFTNFQASLDRSHFDQEREEAENLNRIKELIKSNEIKAGQLFYNRHTSMDFQPDLKYEDLQRAFIKAIRITDKGQFAKDCSLIDFIEGIKSKKFDPNKRDAKRNWLIEQAEEFFTNEAAIETMQLSISYEWSGILSELLSSTNSNKK